MTRTFVLGRDHTLYMQLGSDRGAGFPTSWGAMPNAERDKLKRIDIVQDASTSLGNDLGNFPTRANGRFAANVAVEASASFNFTILWAPETPAGPPGLPAGVFDDLILMYTSGCPRAFMIADDIIGQSGGSEVRINPPCGSAGTKVYGLWADFVMSGLDWGQSLREAGTADITLELALGAFIPEFGELAAAPA